MKNIKNYLIALLAGLLVLSLSTQPSQGAGTSATAKAIEYDHCLTRFEAAVTTPWLYLDAHIKGCAKYKP